jgi:3-phytase
MRHSASGFSLTTAKVGKWSLCLLLTALGSATVFAAAGKAAGTVVQPRIVTEPVRHDTDDPAIWVHPEDPAQSLILGTDKDVDGALYVFNLQGRIVHDKVIRGLSRPNNVDIARGVMLGGKQTDIALVSERYANRLRAYRLPDLAPIDAGGIPVFVGERARDVMGVAAYRRPNDGASFVIVSRSDQFAPQQGYLHQYRLVDDGRGTLRGVFSRAFGNFSGRKEIEALSVDQQAGHVYASDETFGLRKYHADPAHEDADDELSVFGTQGFARDHEGSAVLRRAGEPALLFVSDQQAGELRLFALEGPMVERDGPRYVGRIRYAARDTDGIDLTAAALPGFPQGLLVAMSTDKTFHYYDLGELLAALIP